jgi:hypothetical protein
VDIPGLVKLQRRKNESCLECGEEIGPSARRAAYGREFCSQVCLLDGAEKRGWQMFQA